MLPSASALAAKTQKLVSLEEASPKLVLEQLGLLQDRIDKLPKKMRAESQQEATALVEQINQLDSFDALSEDERKALVVRMEKLRLAVEKEEGGAMVICRQAIHVGTNITSNVCTTRRERELAEQEAEKSIRDIQTQSQIGRSPGGG
jgi:hypothetical protein